MAADGIFGGVVWMAGTEAVVPSGRAAGGRRAGLGLGRGPGRGARGRAVAAGGHEVFAMAIAGNFSFGLTGGYVLFGTYACYLVYATILS